MEIKFLVFVYLCFDICFKTDTQKPYMLISLSDSLEIFTDIPYSFSVYVLLYNKSSSFVQDKVQKGTWNKWKPKTSTTKMIISVIHITLKTWRKICHSVWYEFSLHRSSIIKFLTVQTIQKILRRQHWRLRKIINTQWLRGGQEDKNALRVFKNRQAHG